MLQPPSKETSNYRGTASRPSDYCRSTRLGSSDAVSRSTDDYLARLRNVDNYTRGGNYCTRRKYANRGKLAPSRGKRSRSSFLIQHKGMLVLVLVLVAAGGIGRLTLSLIEGTALDDIANLSSNSEVKSTPQSEWKQGSVPFLFQTDSAWASQSYADANVGESGCGPTCMSMVYIALTGKSDKDPAVMCSFAQNQGYASEAGTEWLFLTEGAANLGLTSQEIPLNEMSIRQELMKGNPIICSLGPGDFTATGHFIVLVDVDENGKLIIHDPNNAERSSQSWDFGTIMNQTLNLWSYSID